MNKAIEAALDYAASRERLGDDSHIDDARAELAALHAALDAADTLAAYLGDNGSPEFRAVMTAYRAARAARG